MFADRFKEYGEDSEPTLRMSNMGKPLRQLWYDLKGFKGEQLTPETRLKFLYGHFLEALLVFLAAEAGHDVTDVQRTVELDGVLGHIDCMIDGVLVDVKSCSTYSFRKFKEGTLINDDPFGYIGQLAGYSLALGSVDGAFLAVDKTLGKLCLLKFTGKELSDRYPVRDRIRSVREALDRPIEPERCYQPVPLSKQRPDGSLALAVGCSYCNHKFRCWSDANDGTGIRTFVYSTGPKFLVKVDQVPRVDEITLFPIKDIT